MNFLKNSSLYLAGEILSKIIPFLILPYLSRSLGSEGFGELALYQAWVALFIIFISYAQESVIIRSGFFYGRRSLKLILASGYIYCFLVSACLIFISYITSNYLFIVILLCSFSHTVIKIELTVNQACGNSLRYAAIQVCSAFLSVLATFFIFEFYDSSSLSRIIAVIFSNFATLGFFLFFAKQAVPRKFRFSFRLYKISFSYFFAYCSPLLLNNFSSFFKGQFDRFLISNKFSNSELGEYSAGFQIASVFLFVCFAIFRALEPLFFSKVKSGEITVLKVNRFCVNYGFLFFLPYLFFSILPNSFFTLLLGPEFFRRESVCSSFCFCFLY